MGKRRKARGAAFERSLEEQIAELDENAPPGPKMWNSARGLELEAPSAERMEYLRKRLELTDAKRQRDAKRLADPGPDEGGRYSPSPYAVQHGHRVEVAPQKLRITKESGFPKRITPQRMIDRYYTGGHIEPKEWRAANRLWQLWCEAGLNPKMIGSYSPVVVQSSANPDRMFTGRVSATVDYLAAMSAVPYRSKGVVMHVVIMDGAASDWALMRGIRGSDSRAHGMSRLRAGLSALVAHFDY